MVFCLEKDTITIPHAKSNLYSVPKFIVIKGQKGLLTRNEVVAREQLCLQTTTATISSCNKNTTANYFCHKNLIKLYKIKHSCFFYECSECLLIDAKKAIFVAISWREQGTFRWLNYDILFVLDQHTHLDFNSVDTTKLVCGWICLSIRTHYYDFRPTSLCSYFLLMYT